MTEQSNNAYSWDTYQVPQLQVEDLEAESETFKIRHLRAGRTGARKTWSAAPALLTYLTLQDGFRNLCDKNIDSDHVLDVAATSQDIIPMTILSDARLNVLELGGGSGYVSVGLAKAFPSTATMPSSPHNMKIMCTDMDRNTIKNMRHNICTNKETKTVAIETLEWGDDIGGEKFAKALERKFGRVSDSSIPYTESPDPILLLTHVIASDVHFGENTLDPLSSIVSSLKRRNPNVQVIIMLKERNPNSVAELVEQIELKVKNSEQDITVHCRDVIESGTPDFRLKLIEC